ncbi:MAG: multiheme c-type cytochrome [Candidatus Electryonea clarkiae]|nr:multiheme c-type cytochrome [Candidatus Electryonea clarkiae]MDP8288181.1 multiheme c-type cytochrome [Candidatus Electryonea clarkiae]
MSLRKINRLVFLLSLIGLTALVLAGCGVWSGMIRGTLPEDSRPYKINLESDMVNESEFDLLARELRSEFNYKLDHIERFRKAGIRSYEGPSTCLQCHKTVQIEDAMTGEIKSVDLMENLLSSTHYRFFTEDHSNVWGFNGKLADNFPMGKIDRPCPKPGSFAFTAWAELVITEHGDTLSEGCGQCHIGGQYQAPLGEIMPGYKTRAYEKDAIDCLICHAVAYDMNKKQVVVDPNDLGRWGQDRSMKAALSTETPTSQTCLRCHQHNMGGDIYIDSLDSSYMESMLNKGNERPRIAHPGSKRGTPFSPSWDVHAAAGMECIDCHTTEGHLIAKGTHTTTMMTNDLPDVEVKCETCHTSEPHVENDDLADFYNMHTERLACVTCHIPNLVDDNATRRDFDTPEYEEHPGIYVYSDIQKESEHPEGMTFRWWNGDATFLGNPIGDNPNGANLYSFYKPTHVWEEYKDYDYEKWYEETMRPIAKRKPSKLYAMKIFNGKQHIDLANIGPFGGMFVPYNLPTYYVTGDPRKAGSREMDKDMMKMMYGFMFDVYLMDEFMSYMDIDGWDTGAYADVKEMKNVEPRWIPVDASMEISHAVRREGALTCNQCHAPDGILDWRELGYTEAEVKQYQENPLD